MYEYGLIFFLSDLFYFRKGLICFLLVALIFITMLRPLEHGFITCNFFDVMH